MFNLIARLFLIALALLVVASYVPGIEVKGFYIALVVAFILGILNLTVKPVLFILTLPFNILTFGLFALVLNGFLFWFVASFVQDFNVDGFVPAFFGALIISITSSVVSRIF